MISFSRSLPPGVTWGSAAEGPVVVCSRSGLPLSALGLPLGPLGLLECSFPDAGSLRSGWKPDADISVCTVIMIGWSVVIMISCGGVGLPFSVGLVVRGGSLVVSQPVCELSTLGTLYVIEEVFEHQSCLLYVSSFLHVRTYCQWSTRCGMVVETRH